MQSATICCIAVEDRLVPSKLGSCSQSDFQRSKKLSRNEGYSPKMRPLYARRGRGVISFVFPRARSARNENILTFHGPLNIRRIEGERKKDRKGLQICKCLRDWPYLAEIIPFIAQHRTCSYSSRSLPDRLIQISVRFFTDDLCR